jgi:LL-diaminopimelate aminotransferase
VTRGPDSPAGRVRDLPAYPLAAIPARRRALEAAGVDIIDLGTGDADLPPPPAAVDALREAAGDLRLTRYPFQSGLPAFRTTVSGWMERRFGVRIDPHTELLPLIGSKEGLAHLAMARLDPGDAAVFPDPGYAAYAGGVILAGGVPVPVRLRAEDDFLLLPEHIPAELLPNVRLLTLNYPGNPTAAIAPREYLAEMVAFCRARGIWLAYDNAYSEIAFDGYLPPSIFEIPGAREVAVEFHSFSKTYNVTGWRLGWACGHAGAIAALQKVKTYVDTGAYLGIQAAGVAAIGSWEEWLPGNVEAFRRRRDAAVEGFREAGFQVSVPRAALYLWIPVPGGAASEPFVLRALEEAGVVLLPGSAMGAGGEGFFRVALTVPEDRLREAARRMAPLGNPG